MSSMSGLEFADLSRAKLSLEVRRVPRVASLQDSASRECTVVYYDTCVACKQLRD